MHVQEDITNITILKDL